MKHGLVRLGQDPGQVVGILGIGGDTEAGPQGDTRLNMGQVGGRFHAHADLLGLGKRLRLVATWQDHYEFVSSVSNAVGLLIICFSQTGPDGNGHLGQGPAAVEVSMGVDHALKVVHIHENQ